MDLSQPFLVLCPGTTGRVLGVLTTTDRAMSANEIARRAGVSHSAATTAVRALAAAGVVWWARLTQTHLYYLDPDHLAAPLLRALAALEDELCARVHDLVAGWSQPPAWVGLPGRDASRPGVTLLVVGPDRAAAPRWDTQLAELDERIARWTGAAATIHTQTLPVNPARLDDVWSSPARTVFGEVPAALAQPATHPDDAIGLGPGLHVPTSDHTTGPTPADVLPGSRPTADHKAARRLRR